MNYGLLLEYFMCFNFFFGRCFELVRCHAYFAAALMYLISRYQEDPVSFASSRLEKRQPGHPHITWLSDIQQDLKKHHFMLAEAADLAQNRPL